MIPIGLLQPPLARKKAQWKKLSEKFNCYRNENALKDFKSKIRLNTQQKILSELAEYRNAKNISGKKKRRRAEKRYDKYSKI